MREVAHIARINLLDPRVAELIAAGEVVDRPASVVKELVENAIDAGSRRVAIELERGGVGLIRVIDDGCGIDREEVPRAFIRHATSKISTAADLDAIGTLGFRGEALPSIAAVSRVTLTTRTRGEAAGCRYIIDGSGRSAEDDVGCPVGTAIEVRDLFYNTPARMKFLKKDVTEGNAVASLLDRMALSNPHIAFTLSRDGQRKLQTTGDGDLLSVIRVVCGSDAALQMLPVSQTTDNIGVEGFISRPQVGRATRSLQICFINGRYVRSRTCVSAVEEAYKNRLMTGRFPACVLNLTIDTALVDVNVHPAKLEVRFSSERAVYSAVYAAALAALAQSERRAPVQPPPRKITPFSLNDFDHSDRQLQLGSGGLSSLVTLRDTPPARPVGAAIAAGPRPARGSPPASHPQPGFDDGAGRPPPSIRSVAPDRPLRRPDIECDAPTHPPTSAFRPDPPPPDPAPVAAESHPTAEIVEDYRVIGELFDTYVIVEQGDRMLLIDKHAAHERYLYNGIKHLGESGDRQLLLTPAAVTLSRDEYFALTQNPDAVRALGLVAEDFGDRTLLVREVPMLLDGCDLGVLLSEAAAGVLRSKSDLTPSALDELLYSVSCRAAVMAGRRSSLPELDRLVELVLGPEQIRFCPHGRPVLTEMGRREIEKLFGRLG